MWNQEKLQSYIDNQVEENINLDYKAAGSLVNSDSKKSEISKDVSAFANSDGGLIIYGVTENNTGAKFLPDKIDSIDRNSFSKETLEQIINSRINPTIHGIIIHPITIGDPNDDKVVYVVEIPKSNTAHQAYDKKYYRRYNFQSVPMDDWEIKDIINRQTKTQFKIKFRACFPEGQADIWIGSKVNVPMKFDILVYNTGQKIIHHVDFTIVGDSTSQQYVHDSKLDDDMFEIYYTNEIEHKIPYADGKEYVINVQRTPILSKTYRVIGKIKFSSTFFKSDAKITLTTVTDDNRTSFTLTGIEIYERLIKY